MPYVVLVADNFHYMDPEECDCYGEFADADVAVEHCRRLVDEYLESAYRPGITAAELWDSYTSFGDDPFISSRDAAPVAFSAWTYARERCAQMCARESAA